MDGRPRTPRGPGQNSAYRPLSRDQSSSARQMVVAVQAAQIGRASSIVPSGSG